MVRYGKKMKKKRSWCCTRISSGKAIHSLTFNGFVYWLVGCLVCSHCDNEESPVSLGPVDGSRERRVDYYFSLGRLAESSSSVRNEERINGEKIRGRYETFLFPREFHQMKKLFHFFPLFEITFIIELNT